MATLGREKLGIGRSQAAVREAGGIVAEIGALGALLRDAVAPQGGGLFQLGIVCKPRRLSLSTVHWISAWKVCTSVYLTLARLATLNHRSVVLDPFGS